jgi:hypothetical protein
MARRHGIITLAALATLCLPFTVSCGKPLSGDECSQLLDKYVVLLATSDRPEASGEERNHMRQRAKELSKRDPQFGKCSQHVSRRKFECAMNAPNTDLFEQCLL